MAREIDKGFHSLAIFVEVVKADSKQARRIVEKRREVDEFLASEGLAEVEPRRELARFQKESAERRWVRYQNHLAAVAQEALRVEGEEFVHSTKASVVEALKKRISDGDPRLIPGYTSATLRRQIFSAAHEALSLVSSTQLREKPLADLTSTDEFKSKFGKCEGWIETFNYASQVLPQETDVTTMMFLLLSFSKDTGPDLNQFRTVQGRVAEIQRGLDRISHA